MNISRLLIYVTILFGMSMASASSLGLLNTFVEDLRTSPEVRAELARLRPQRDPFELRLRDVLTAPAPPEPSRELQRFLFGHSLALGLTEEEVQEHIDRGFIRRVAREAVRRSTDRAAQDRAVREAMREMGDLTPETLARTFTVQAITDRPRMTRAVAQAIFEWALAGGHRVPYAGGYSDAFDDLTPSGQNALRELGYPTLAELQATFTADQLLQRFGPATLKALLPFAAAEGFALRDTRKIEGLTDRARTVLRKLGDPSPRELAERYTKLDVRNLPHMRAEVAEELIAYAARAGFPLAGFTATEPDFILLSPKGRAALGRLGNPTAVELVTKHTASSLVALGWSAPILREVHAALRTAGFELAPGPELRRCGGLLVGGGKVYRIEE